MQRHSYLDWTVVRIPRVVQKGPTWGYRSGRLKLGPWSSVTSGDAAQFMLDCLDRNLFVREAPMVAS